jgi:hypothetical protein
LKNNKKVLLVGAGNLGTRYLQGLKISPYIDSIYIYDISLDAANKAIKVFNQTASNFSPNIYLISDLGEVPKKLDLVILSTNSFGRHKLIKNIKKYAVVNSWILEKILSTNLYGLKQIKELLDDSKFAWVNHWMRIPTYFNDLKNSLSSSEPIHIQVIGGNWGLACNATHFMDFAQWLSSDQIKKVENYSLDKWFESKRHSYYDLNGNINFTFRYGSTLYLESKANEASLKIKIQQKDANFEVFFNDNLIKVNSKNKTINYSFPYQSLLTAPIVEDIFFKRNPKIPRINETINNHKILLNLLKKHWALSPQLNNKKFRIT